MSSPPLPRPARARRPCSRTTASCSRAGTAVRRQTLDEIKALGADAVKFSLEWSSVAPGGATRPANFDATNPAAYPQSGWQRYDDLIADAQARGLRVMVAIAPPAPGWATKKRGDTSGVDRPSAAQLALFSQAVGRRYRDKIDWWTIWNEPNLPRFLYPQSRNGIPYAPHLYRAMVRGAVDGLRRSGNGGDSILFGELLPIGRRGSQGQHQRQAAAASCASSSASPRATAPTAAAPPAGAAARATGG